MILNALKNIQFQQLINLTLLIYIAYLNNTLQTSPLMAAELVVFATIFEAILTRESYIPYSAGVTALGVVLMVGWLKWYIPFVVIALAILQKRFLKVGGSHIFNPSNFALIAALLIFYPKALPIVGQLGFQGYFVLTVTLILAIFILIRVNRVTIPLTFIVAYIAFEYLIIRHHNPNWEFTHFVNQFYTTSFIVYALFMLTDPKTTPNSISKQAIFATLTAAILVTLEYFTSQRTWNLFLALFLASVFFIPLYRELDKKEWIKYFVILLFAISSVILISTHKPLYFSM